VATELERLAFAWKSAGRPKSLRASAWPDFALFRLQMRKHFTTKLPDAAERLQELARFVGVPRDELLDLLWRAPEEELPTEGFPVWCLRRDRSSAGALLFRCRYDRGQWFRAQESTVAPGSSLRAPIHLWKPDIGVPPSLPSFL
jgi:hypothetical protein